MLTVSICSDDVKEIETFYAVLEEERPANLNRNEIRQEIQLLNKIEETICSSNAVMEETKLCIVKYKTNVLNTIPPDKLEDLNSLD